MSISILPLPAAQNKISIKKMRIMSMRIAQAVITDSGV